jgi:hypothetical protein
MSISIWSPYKIILITLVTVSVIFLSYIWLAKHISYSDGERVGYIQKISKKGWICKTWEGEMQLQSIPGLVAEKFYFTTENDSVVSEINNSLGRKVALTYKQHKGLPTSCFGDTEYFAIELKVLD